MIKSSAFLAIALFTASFPGHAEDLDIDLGQVRMSVQRYPSAGKNLLFWLPSEHGISERQPEVASRLAENGIEVWIPDLHGTWFLSTGRYSLTNVPVDSVQRLLAHAVKKSDKTLYLLAASRTAPLALEIARAFQLQAADIRRLGGAIILHPKLYVHTPQGAEDPEFLPIVGATSLPVFLIQPELAAGHWRLRQLIAALEAGGARVYAQSLPGVSDGFVTRSDPTDEERKASSDFPDLVARAIRLLESEGGAPPSAAPLADQASPGAPPARERLLRRYEGQSETPALRLKNLAGDYVDLGNLKEKVMLVTFWTTWCPPCVEEIPSLQRLYSKLRGRGLEILAVDVGEPPELVQEFMQKHPADFPVLLDPEGQALLDWKIYAFPTSLVLDRAGSIRYAVYGALEWDADEIVETIEQLITDD